MPEAMGKFYKSYFDGVSEITTELMGFIETRVARDMELGKELSRCQDWTSASKLQSDWSRQTQEDYLQESKKLSDMATSLVQRSFEPWSSFSK